MPLKMFLKVFEERVICFNLSHEFQIVPEVFGFGLDKVKGLDFSCVRMPL